MPKNTSKYWTTIYVEFKGEEMDSINLMESILVGLMRLCNINRKIIHTEVVDMGRIVKREDVVSEEVFEVKNKNVNHKRIEDKYKEECSEWTLKR